MGARGPRDGASGTTWWGREACLGPWLAAWLLGVAWLCAATPAGAHELGLSRGDYAARGEAVEVTLAFARRDAITLLPALDADRDGAVGEAEVANQGEALGKRAFGGLSASLDDKPCAAEPGSVRLVDEDGLEVRGRFVCGASTEIGGLTLAVPLLADLSTGHRQLLKLSRGGQVHEAMLHRREPSFSLAATASGGSEEIPQEGQPLPVSAFFVVGVEHILMGWDHVVFLVGLVLVAGFGDRRKRGILKAVTAFTLAHSITLALSVMGVVAPSPHIIEPLIALSVAYVGVENFLVKDPAKRWRVTLPFGLIHGFGFAGALGEVGLPRGQVPAALALFNLGVEAGQLALLVVLLPIVFWLAKRPAYATWGVRLASGLIVVAGLFWFFERVL